jgi:PAN domain-containing protein
MRRLSWLLLVLLAALALATAPGRAEPTYEPGIDRIGSDYRNFELPRPRPRVCQEACLNDQACRAWTFVQPGILGPLASCWLKAQVPEPRPNVCCVSGIR